jgi:hypothetical protein
MCRQTGHDDRALTHRPSIALTLNPVPRSGVRRSTGQAGRVNTNRDRFFSISNPFVHDFLHEKFCCKAAEMCMYSVVRIVCAGSLKHELRFCCYPHSALLRTLQAERGRLL